MQNSNVFRVFVNKVDVGALPEQDYRSIISEITSEVKKDRRLILAQALNFVLCLLRFSTTLMRIVPVIIFAPLAVTLLIAPEMVTEMITVMRTATPADITNGLRLIMITFFLPSLMIGISFVFVFTGHRFGYINQFENAINERISLRVRAILEVPAEGEVEVHVGKGFRV